MKSRLSWLVLSALLIPSPLFAQTANERTAARSAAESGVQAFAEGDYPRALDLLRKAESVVHAPTHLLYIARSLVELGKLVEARESYLVLTNETLENSSEAFLAAQESAAAELAALEPRIPSATISVDGANGPDLKVAIDGEALMAIFLGVSTPINPGHHVVEASAPGMRSAHVEIDIRERRSEFITLVLRANEAALAPAGTSTSSVSGDTADAGAHRPVPPGVYVGLATTGVLAAGAVVTGFLTLGKNKDYDAINDGTQLDEAERTQKSAQMLGLTTDILWGAAAVSAGITAYFYFTRPAEQQRSSALRLTPLVGPHVAALNLSGGF